VILANDPVIQDELCLDIINKKEKKIQNDPMYQNKLVPFANLRLEQKEKLFKEATKDLLENPARIIRDIANGLKKPIQKVKDIVNDMEKPIQKFVEGPQPQNNPNDPNDPTSLFNQGTPGNLYNQRQASNMANETTLNSENAQTVNVEANEYNNNTLTEEANSENNLATAAKFTAVAGAAKIVSSHESKMEHKAPTPKPGATHEKDETEKSLKNEVKHKIEKNLKNEIADIKKDLMKFMKIDKAIGKEVVQLATKAISMVLKA